MYHRMIRCHSSSTCEALYKWRGAVQRWANNSVFEYIRIIWTEYIRIPNYSVLFKNRIIFVFVFGWNFQTEYIRIRIRYKISNRIYSYSYSVAGCTCASGADAHMDGKICGTTLLAVGSINILKNTLFADVKQYCTLTLVIIDLVQTCFLSLSRSRNPKFRKRIWGSVARTCTGQSEGIHLEMMIMVPAKFLPLI